MIGATFVVGVGDGAELVDDKTAFILSLEAGGGTNVATSDTTNVEGTKRKLRTGLTDSLGCDNADGLTLLDHLAGG